MQLSKWCKIFFFKLKTAACRKCRFFLSISISVIHILFHFYYLALTFLWLDRTHQSECSRVNGSQHDESTGFSFVGFVGVCSARCCSTICCETSFEHTVKHSVRQPSATFCKATTLHFVDSIEQKYFSSDIFSSNSRVTISFTLKRLVSVINHQTRPWKMACLPPSWSTSATTRVHLRRYRSANKAAPLCFPRRSCASRSISTRWPRASSTRSANRSFSYAASDFNVEIGKSSPTFPTVARFLLFYQRSVDHVHLCPYGRRHQVASTCINIHSECVWFGWTIHGYDDNSSVIRMWYSYFMIEFWFVDVVRFYLRAVRLHWWRLFWSRLYSCPRHWLWQLCLAHSRQRPMARFETEFLIFFYSTYFFHSVSFDLIFCSTCRHVGAGEFSDPVCCGSRHSELCCVCWQFVSQRVASFAWSVVDRHVGWPGWFSAGLRCITEHFRFQRFFSGKIFVSSFHPSFIIIFFESDSLVRVSRRLVGGSSRKLHGAGWPPAGAAQTLLWHVSGAITARPFSCLRSWTTQV